MCSSSRYRANTSLEQRRDVLPELPPFAPELRGRSRPASGNSSRASGRSGAALQPQRLQSQNIETGIAERSPGRWAKAPRVSSRINSSSGVIANPDHRRACGPRAAAPAAPAVLHRGVQEQILQVQRRQVALAAPVELRVGQRDQQGGAGDRAESNSARSSRSNSAAVRTRIPASFRRQRAGIRKERILLVELRELLLHHAADKHHRQHPLARFVRAQHMDHVAPAGPSAAAASAGARSSARATTSPAGQRGPRAALVPPRPPLRQTRLAPRTGCAIPAPSRVSRDLAAAPGGTDCAAYGSAPPSPSGRSRRRATLRAPPARPACGADARPTWAPGRLHPAARFHGAQAGVRNLLAHREIEAVHRPESAKRGARCRAARVFS